MIPAENFFEKQTPESAAKTDIVTNFFVAWLNIIGSVKRYTGPLAYLDLFSGPGKFDDGTKSTPLLILEHILASRQASRFHVILNEMDNKLADRLKQNVDLLPNLGNLATAPVLLRTGVDQHNVTGFLKYLKDFPAVLFVDPFGYKGISLELFRHFVNVGWGRDAIFFFNYRRINAALSNVQFVEHMRAMLGAERAHNLQQTLEGLQPAQREQHVYRAVEDALHEINVKFVFRYEFEKRGDSLFFISQKEKGLRTMKDVMKKRSTSDDDGVPSFSFSRYGKQPKQLNMFNAPDTPLKRLHDDLLERFSGRTMTFRQIVSEHHPGTNYVDKNYRNILQEMEKRDEIVVSPKTRRAGTFGPRVQIAFPKRKGSCHVTGIIH